MAETVTERFEEVLAAAIGGRWQADASELTEDQVDDAREVFFGSELEGRLNFPGLRKPLTAIPADPSEIASAGRGVYPWDGFGGIASKAQRHAFLKSSEAPRILQDLLVSSTQDEGAIDQFVEDAVKYGFKNKEGKPNPNEATVFAALLLSVYDSGTFVEFRIQRWQRTARHLLAPAAPGTPGARIHWASQIAREMFESAIFQRLAGDCRDLRAVSAFMWRVFNRGEGEEARRLLRWPLPSERDTQAG